MPPASEPARPFGHYEDLFVAKGDRRRGKTHCLRCGGRTRQRNKDKKAMHASCEGPSR
jgi:hypothetical protein